jgi:succinoglycan biosynthesis protein ExoV
VILHHWQGEAPNFGDELNTLLWPRLLPNFFDGKPDVRFLGIGSILDGRHPADQVKLVAGSGYAGYESKPRLDRSWVIHWVRGPLTAAAIGVPPHLALGDPAMLLPLVMSESSEQPAIPVGFMPHFESLSRGPWEQAAILAGITLIDPRDPPALVAASVGRCRLLLSESLHGAVVADALRVPWIPLRPLMGMHRSKWRDWAETLDLRIRPRALPAASGAEWLAVSGLAGRHRGRQLIDRYREELNAIWPARLLARAADALRQAAATEPHLSSQHALDRCQSRMMDAITALRRQPIPRSAARAGSAPAATDLHQADNSEYQLKPVG